MKNIKFLFAILVVLVSSCEEVENQYPSEVVTVPQIILKGEKTISIRVGDPYSDAGATYINDQGQSSDLAAADNPVDISVPNLYVVSYEIENPKGFRIIEQRFVAVTDIDPSWDLSGTYERTSNGILANLTKVANGLYLNDNIGGSTLVLEAYMAQLDDSTITVPAQVVADGSVLDCVEETFTVMSGDTSFSFRVDNPSFGFGVRTFVKQ
jgi:hypothetical protein